MGLIDTCEFEEIENLFGLRDFLKLTSQTLLSWRTLNIIGCSNIGDASSDFFLIALGSDWLNTLETIISYKGMYFSRRAFRIWSSVCMGLGLRLTFLEIGGFLESRLFLNLLRRDVD